MRPVSSWPAGSHPLLPVPMHSEPSELRASPYVPTVVTVLTAVSPGGPPSPHFAPFPRPISRLAFLDLPVF